MSLKRKLSRDRLERGRIYKISWIDTFQRIRWLDVSDIKADAKEYGSYICSVGLYVGTYHGYIVIASHYNAHRDMADWGGITWIPKGCVREVKRI